MKKVFLFLLAASALVSCGSDDGDGGGKTPSSVVITAQGLAINYAFTYDNKKRMTQMIKTGDQPATVSFVYGENGKASNMTVTAGGNTTSMALAYDDQKRLTSVTEQGQQPQTIVWNGENSFTFDGSLVTLTDKGDLQSFTSGDPISRTFANSKKGIFGSVKSFDPFLLLIADFQSVLFASKTPISTITSAGSTFMYTNTFEGGTLSNATITTPNGTATILAMYN